MANLDYKRKLALALRRKEALARQVCFNPDNPESRPTPEQERAMQDINDVPQRYVVGGNQSGKSNLGARECSWIFSNTHPFWKKPDRPLTLIVIGQIHKNIRQELWENKLVKFLGPTGYRVYSDGNSLDRVVHDNGNTILFFSHDAADVCRKRVQGFVADYVWLDEMPGSFPLLQELFARCQANLAPLLCTFTPLLRSPEIRKHVDEGNPKFIKKYVLKTLDNPIYADEEKRENLLSNWSVLSESARATRAEGAWSTGENSVYDFVEERHVEQPYGYHESWRHMEAIDPASAGKAGFLLLAEDPDTYKWYVVKEEYIEGKAPTELLARALELTKNVNLIKRVCDSHEAGYIKEAQLKRVWYEIPHKKTQRKKELITGLQGALVKETLKVAPWCQLMKDEFMTCQWADSGDRIINARSYHLLDCLQYAVDCLPPKLKTKMAQTRDRILIEKDRQRRADEATKKKRQTRIQTRRSRWR